MAYQRDNIGRHGDSSERKNIMTKAKMAAKQWRGGIAREIIEITASSDSEMKV